MGRQLSPLSMIGLLVSFATTAIIRDWPTLGKCKRGAGLVLGFPGTKRRIRIKHHWLSLVSTLRPDSSGHPAPGVGC